MNSKNKKDCKENKINYFIAMRIRYVLMYVIYIQLETNV